MKKLTRTLATSALLVLPVIAVAQLSTATFALPTPGGEVKISTEGGTSVIIEDNDKKVDVEASTDGASVIIAGDRKEVNVSAANDGAKVEISKEDSDDDTRKEVSVTTTSAKTTKTESATEADTSTALPTTGAGENIAGILGLGATAYLATRLVMQRRELRALGA